ncbi:MAG: SHOCT domain-containing protein [Campylobacteraceae bacterium]|nr:SHOCT domain-containing protein [Campylobacteraceae bacterium]
MMFFWAIVIIVLFLLFFNNRPTDKSYIILRERFAKGEITKEEYETLKSSI